MLHTDLLTTVFDFQKLPQGHWKWSHCLKITLYRERNKSLTIRTRLVPMEIQQPDLALLRGRPWNLCLKFLQMFGFATSQKQMWPRTWCCQFLYRGESPASCFPSLAFCVIAASPAVCICWRPGSRVRVMGASVTCRGRWLRQDLMGHPGASESNSGCRWPLRTKPLCKYGHWRTAHSLGYCALLFQTV